MSAVLTRRGLALAGAAALGTAVAGIPASAAAEPGNNWLDPDAELLSLIERHPVVLAACVQAEDEAERLGGMALGSYPPQPKVLNWLPSDFPRTSYGRGASDPVGDTEDRRYLSRGVEWLRRGKFVAQWTEEAEARRREIVEAHDRWHAECGEVDVRTGYAAAKQAKRAAVLVLREVESEIGETEARTLPGLRAKALWVAAHIVGDTYADEDLGETFARQVARFGEVAT
ncbi:hypothetical protein D3273_25195 [Lichenibacterium minor]|uniref:Uncharacterized protein n=1 Tax=Lichenibacterium minor TaxID=2316528 RepID=A0A4Q2U2X2_9HYPH|nr:hypothetical protein [Lichenibacterium minor]RYC29217.1 hypothetical protein D3273_25195 [Lichenibacterium minor]